MALRYYEDWMSRHHPEHAQQLGLADVSHWGASKVEDWEPADPIGHGSPPKRGADRRLQGRR